METLKKFFGLIFLIGLPFPLLFANYEHQIWFVLLAYLFSFVGTGLIFGFSNFRTRPTQIGNFDDDGIMPKINQTWMIFFISLVINLTVANLF
jgi:hypothetical protein